MKKEFSEQKKDLKNMKKELRHVLVGLNSIREAEEKKLKNLKSSKRS